MKRILIITMCMVTLLGCEAGLSAATQTAVADVAVPSETAQYFDGKRWRTVWVSDQEMVEFVADDGKDSLVPAMAPEAELISERTRTRVWRLPRDGSVAATIRAVRQERAGERLSPRFYRSANGASPMSLSDTIIVRFKQGWSQQEIQAWARRNDVELVRQMAMQPHAYVVRTEAGMAALETANAIQNSGEVESATPDWWVEAHLR